MTLIKYKFQCISLMSDPYKYVWQHRHRHLFKEWESSVTLFSYLNLSSMALRVVEVFMDQVPSTSVISITGVEAVAALKNIIFKSVPLLTATMCASKRVFRTLLEAHIVAVLMGKIFFRFIKITYTGGTCRDLLPSSEESRHWGPLGIRRSLPQRFEWTCLKQIALTN